MTQKDYDTTIARIAGNIASGWMGQRVGMPSDLRAGASECVRLARAIVAEVKRTEPEKPLP